MDLKSTLLELFIQYVLPILATAAFGGLVWLLVQLSRWFAAKGATNRFFLVTERVAHLASVIVADIDATMRPKLKSAAEDGKISPDEAAELKKAALDALKKSLSERGLTQLQGVLDVFGGPVETYLSGAIERAVTSKRAAEAIALGRPANPPQPRVWP